MTSRARTSAGGASALADIDHFLQTWVPKITHSPAFPHYSSLASWELRFGLHRLTDAATVPSTSGAGVHCAQALSGNRAGDQSPIGEGPGTTSVRSG
jgi:hypothetical protein